VGVWFNSFSDKLNKLHFAYTAKMYSKMCHYASDERCADFILKKHQKRLAARTRWCSLQRSPRPLAGFKEYAARDKGRGQGKEKIQEGVEHGRERNMKGRGTGGRELREWKGEEWERAGRGKGKEKGGEFRPTVISEVGAYAHDAILICFDRLLDSLLAWMTDWLINYVVWYTAFTSHRLGGI